MENALTLYELNQLVHEVIDTSFDRTYWVTAELSDVSVARNGHCYMELLQKSPLGDQPIAKARGTIWARTWMQLRPQFENVTGQTLQSGMQVMLEVKVNFHEVYGYALNITGIDPNYTLGDIARRRREIIDTLKREGIFDDNRNLTLPRLLNRIAVISADSAAGYGDFCNQLDNNPHRLRFTHRLFPARMQGSEVEASVIAALDRIYEEADRWDAVVIIRGGGSTSDLAGFDSLRLGEHVAQFPLPVITGIGHERDNTVIDEVAHTRVKTPTAAAEFLIAHQLQELTLAGDYEHVILTFAASVLSEESNRLKLITNKLPSLYKIRQQSELHHIDRMMASVSTAIQSHRIEMKASVELMGERLRHVQRNLINSQRSLLQLAESKIESAGPERVLRLGYSISRLNGKALTDVTTLKAGDRIITTLANGSFSATVDPQRPHTDEELRRRSPFALGEDRYLA